MIFQLIQHGLLTPTNFRFHDQVITSLSGILDIKWSPLNIGIAFTEMSSEMQDFLSPIQKYEPTQSLFYSFVCYQFDIYFYVGSFDEESTEDMERKKLWVLTLDHPGDNEDSISFFIFSYLQWNMITTSFSSNSLPVFTLKVLNLIEN